MTALAILVRNGAMISCLERHSGAPDDLNHAQKDEICNHPELIELTRCRERYVAKIKQCGYPTIKAAKGTKWFEQHDETQRNANSLRAKLIREKLDKIIDEFHETVHTEEVDRRGLLEEESSVCSSR